MHNKEEGNGNEYTGIMFLVCVSEERLVEKAKKKLTIKTHLESKRGGLTKGNMTV